MKILVINAGSSSIKYQLLALEDTDHVLASGLLEKIGESSSHLKHRVFKGSEEKEIEKEKSIADHKQGMALIAEILTDAETGVIQDTSEIDGIGHRVLHCGEIYSDTVLIDDKVIDTIKDHFDLGPLHNPPNLTGIQVAIEFFPQVPQVAVFDTAFHQTIPPHAYHYALPYEMYKKYRIRRYGFHGTSHKYISHETARYLNKPLSETSLISIHLGNGCSMAAVSKGRCVDTSMGLTPLEGLIMGTRCGDVDPAIHSFIATKTGMDIYQIDQMMNKESGLKGLCGTNDVREVLEKKANGDKLAALALDMYCYRIKKYIGSYRAILADLDAIVFTAGVGENATAIRSGACEGLSCIGIDMNPEKNNQKSKGIREIQHDSSPVKILIIPTNEELQIARETRDLLSR